MHLNRKFLSTLFLKSLLENTQLVSCARIPSRSSEPTPREANIPLVSLPDFGSISEYVCPIDLTDSRKRQSSGSGINVPKNQLNNLLLQIQLIELQISTLMLAEDGLLPANPGALASPGPTTATSTPLASPSTAANSSLKTTETACSSNASTTTITETAIVFTTVNVTVTPSSIAQSVAASSTTMIPSSSLTLNEISVAALNSTTSVQGALDTSLGGSSAAAPTSNGSIFPEPQIPAAMPTAGTPIPATTSSGQEAASSTPVEASSAPPAASPTAAAGFTGAVPPASNHISPRYTFNAASSKNIAVYFGQTPVTGETTLEAQCADPSIDIVILAFVIAQLDGGGLYPTVNFGAACSGQTAQMASEAPGLLWCPELATNILNCQKTYGKKVFLSIGGAASQISFSSELEANTFGDVLWNLFGPPGPPGNMYSELRPFGTVEIDGFDVDNEDNLPSHFDTLGLALRTHYETASKHYYLSSAPQCPFPDASDPPALLLLCDFVWVQFYNNPPCEIGSAGFDASIQQWSTALEASTLKSKPRLYVGAPAFREAGVGAYAHIETPEGMMGIARSVERMGLDNFGGVMFWDGPEGMLNLEGGRDIISWAKEGLDS